MQNYQIFLAITGRLDWFPCHILFRKNIGAETSLQVALESKYRRSQRTPRTNAVHASHTTNMQHLHFEICAPAKLMLKSARRRSIPMRLLHGDATELLAIVLHFHRYRLKKLVYKILPED